ncbi:hypothetical protein FSARC_11346 [Fusarium sarcochroum]|uniref:Uncharacterized protein n=1 Tax=Fusarium sarcochroum TaxID=1208366 RepID=A0A8H4X0I3_9HYPO|nr:hypothetical protein FSARC_11346 [Fusarium sarcochroum]
MAPFPFQRLPMEIKIKIIRNLLPETIVPESRAGDAVIITGELAAADSLKRSCPEIREIIEHIRPLKAVDQKGVFMFSFDPDRDTLVVWDMNLPRMIGNFNWIPSDGPVSGLDDGALPIRRLLTCSTYIMPPEVTGPAEEILDPMYWLFGNMDELWQDAPFSTSFPVFSRFPRIQEFVLSIQIAPTKHWHIDVSQMSEPEIAAPRQINDTQGTAMESHQKPSLAENLLIRGIPDDTGPDEEWNLFGNPSAPSSGLGSGPQIDAHGYSGGAMSEGGKWAGFRYYVETEEVEFSPLAWSEVRQFVRRLHAPNGSAMVLPVIQDPQLISRVWIIRPNNKIEPEEQPHHCWTKVKKWEEGDPEWVQQLESTWKMVRGTLLQRGGVEERYSFMTREEQNDLSDSLAQMMIPLLRWD